MAYKHFEVNGYMGNYATDKPLNIQYKIFSALRGSSAKMTVFTKKERSGYLRHDQEYTVEQFTIPDVEIKPGIIENAIDFSPENYFDITFYSGARKNSIFRIVGLIVDKVPSKWSKSIIHELRLKYVCAGRTGTIKFDTLSYVTVLPDDDSRETVWVYTTKAAGEKPTVYKNKYGQEIRVGDWIIAGRKGSYDITVEVGKIVRFTEHNVWYNDLDGKEQKCSSPKSGIFIIDMETPFEDQILTWKLAGRII